jgi:hypothetical protein
MSVTISPGDIVRFYSNIAGKEKFHICIQGPSKNYAATFLFVNSRAGFKADLVFRDGEIPGLPVSSTGKTIISCSILLRIPVRQLEQHNIKVTGKLPSAVARKLANFIKTVPTLSDSDKEIIVDALAEL